ncbi:hypothetical protein TNCV_1903671 [Trichonephila clavipes]|nr:hypothetical protein TNCV_1903671 [Trichonephila clavipes]
MVYGGRRRPVHELRSLRVANWHIVQYSQFFGEYNWKKHLTVEIIRFMILLRSSRKRDEVPIGTEALGPNSVGPCHKIVQICGVYCFAVLLS